MDKSQTVGSFNAPPAHAPKQTSSSVIPTAVPSHVDLIVDKETRERVTVPRREAELAPFAPPQLTDTQMAAMLGKSIDEIQALRGGASVQPDAVRTVGTEPAAVVAVEPPAVVTSSFKPPDIPLRSRPLRTPGKPRPTLDIPVETAPQETAPAVEVPPAAPQPSSVIELARARGTREARDTDGQPYRPAASDSESPARGVPHAIADPGKKVTGGFGAAGEAQYYPLDGLELQSVVIRLLENLIDRVKDDLRFSMAVTYPRVRARVSIEIDAYAKDSGFQIQKLIPPHEKTPIDVARDHGDQCVFVLVQQVQEMSDDGKSIAAPNAIRMEVDLPVPMKQWVETPTGKVLVDVTTDARR